MTSVLPLPASAGNGADPRPRSPRVALLGLGRIGSAVVARLAREPLPGRGPTRITGALVRRTRAEGRLGSQVPLLTDPAQVFRDAPDVLVEVLGGVEPARTLVLAALRRRVPVVTANKTLLAEHGDELFDAAVQSGTPLRCDAAVLAGVPFLGTFAARPLAARAHGVTGIVNGTSGYILSRIDAGLPFAGALAEARDRGLAEADPSRDLDGLDAADKLAVLVRWFAGLSLRPSEITTVSIRGVVPGDLARARELGGTIRPVALARWREPGCVSAFAGPGFVPAGDVLGSLQGVENGIRLERPGLPLHVTGPGAGPDITAATIVDDVIEALEDGRVPDLRGRRAEVERPTGWPWFVTLRGAALPGASGLADLLAAHGLPPRRWGAKRPEAGGDARSLLTFPCDRADLDEALRALSACGLTTSAWPLVEGPDA